MLSNEQQLIDEIKEKLNCEHLIFTETENKDGEFELQRIIDLPAIDDYDGYGTSWSSSDWDSIKTSVTDITVKYFSLETDKDFRIASKFFTDVSYGGLIQAPEPSSLFLLGTVFTGYMLRSRSRRQR